MKAGGTGEFVKRRSQGGDENAPKKRKKKQRKVEKRVKAGRERKRRKTFPAVRVRKGGG